MKKYTLLAVLVLVLATTFAQVIGRKKIDKKKRIEHFSVINDVVYYDSVKFAVYQAKTFSLDGGELVEEYNLLLIDNKIPNKQLIGDLIDYISDRHTGSEVEVEINAENSQFKL